MKIYPGATVIYHPNDSLPEIGDIYAGSFLGAPHTIEERVHISANCSIVGNGHFFLGHDSTIAPNVVVYTSSPKLDERVLGNKYVKGFEIEIDGVNIGAYCFIGAGAVISQGVNICDRVIIGASSLVRHNITQPGTYAGNPLRRLK